MGEVAQAYGVPIILMHMKGTPKTMQASPHYDDLIHEVKIFFQQAVERCLNAGIPRERIILDPGIGFGKTFRHNLCLIRRLNAFSSLELPLLVGASRKAFIRNILKNEGEKDMDPMSPVVETGSQAAAAAAILNGAHMLRVHNVANTLATVKLIDAIQTVSECV
jgi:dihydropteroate synthase